MVILRTLSKTSPQRTPARPSAASATPGEVRIIGGQWRRTRLAVLDSDGLRPTPDRVRETLFNWLGQDLTGWRVLDAFAGSGALGLEAASRGARQVVLLEQQAALATHLRQVVQRLQAEQVRVERADALAWMALAPAQSFDLVLLDPPFGADLYAACLFRALPLISPGGMIYLESDRSLSTDELAGAGVQVHRQGRAGAVHYHLLARPAGLKPLSSSSPD